MIHLILGALAIVLTVYFWATIILIIFYPFWLLWVWITNGFNFRETAKYLAFIRSLNEDRAAEKERESQRQSAEYLRKRKEQLGR